MGVMDWFRRSAAPADEVERSFPPQWLEGYFSWQGNLYPYGLQMLRQGEKQEEIGSDFLGLVHQAYMQNGVIFACMLARLMLFSEARFQYRRRDSGRPGELFGDKELAVLEKPGPGMTTGDLLVRAEQDASLAGNWFANRRGNRIRRMRPDWVDFVIGSGSDEDVIHGDLDAEVLGYVYYPGGRNSGRDPELLEADEVAHYAPVPDPAAHFRGMSWITPVIREVMADQAGTSHKLKSLEEGGIKNAAIKLDTADPEIYQQWVDKVSAKFDGADNAYKRLYLASGMDVVPLGMDLQELDLKNVQGAGETRIAAAAGVPPIIVGLSEGLQAATYSNYGLAMRRFADLTMRPMWRNIAGSLEAIITVPSGAELWYDDRDIPALKDDVTSSAEVQQKEANTIRTLLDAGFVSDSVIDAVRAGDWTRLEHSGLFSVQLQPPGTEEPEAEESLNGDKPTVRELAAALEDLAERT